MKVSLDCNEVTRMISDGLDHKLPAAERAQMRLHFVICKGCRNVDEQMSFIRRAMRQLGQQDPGSEAPVQGKVPLPPV